MTLSKDLLDILVCPKTHAKVVLDGERLVSTDPETRLAYRIEGGFPRMLIDEATELPRDEWQKVMGEHNIDPTGKP